ncbi:uncharacterized protein At5g50100, chloroplastic isoform X2 [Mercurialis annua]|uniref:uncharacterized protein At5g50100, chloroplastic isoform X2 n=1 Tax=Mercurialis annua TaxID=3986 RepID=UPI00215FF117|nr:uncharacterized protein At5g50100, chloroplastic isoform X2 [Mercurialis annua]
MATRGAAAVCSIARKGKFSSLPSVPRYAAVRFQNSPSRFLPQGFTSSPIRAIHDQTAINPVATKKRDEEQVPPNWKIKMLYDGDCPLCMREVNMLRERNEKYGTIKFVDIGSDDYSPEDNQGLDYTTAMGRIHAILSDGTVVTDVEAFRRLYEQVGLGWVYSITKYKPIGKVADSVYSFWAKYRLQITGRAPLEQILEARKKKGAVCNDSSACKM